MATFFFQIRSGQSSWQKLQHRFKEILKTFLPIHALQAGSGSMLVGCRVHFFQKGILNHLSVGTASFDRVDAESALGSRVKICAFTF